MRADVFMLVAVQRIMVYSETPNKIRRSPPEDSLDKFPYGKSIFHLIRNHRRGR
jgi:hypothetical protein